MGAEAFAAKHIGHYLLIQLEDGVEDATAFRTGTFLRPDLERAEAYAAVIDDYRIALVQKREVNPWPDRISVGRTGNNDIVLPDRSVSKLHGYFTVAGSEVRYADAGSKNGSEVSGDPIASEQLVPVCPGDSIRIGRIYASFHDARTLFEFLREVLASPTDEPMNR
jgi:pSer/pThr/pTyr-binding forkhead associated (FHA) protein